ncbi:MAG: Xaa-Pro peptidase family protein [Oscillospiraceae bacterium]|jgi:Xaa-Pro aminopeptidase|nr:Xaa-Pro peptidase family protein [Oscillospiraceae bacterium]
MLEKSAFIYDKVNEYMGKNNFDAMVVTSCENCYYLSGVFLYYNAIVIKKGHEPVLLVKYIDEVLAKKSGFVKDVRAYSPYQVSHKHGGDIIIGEYPAAIAEVVKSLGLGDKKICIADFWAVLRPYLDMKKYLPNAEIIVSEPFLEYLRSVKQDNEIKYISESVGLLDRALDDCANLLVEGTSETAVIGNIARSIWGNEGELTHAIIASGDNSMSPHSKITHRKLKNRDNVVIDLVSCKNGYYGALTRTFVIGQIEKQKSDVYNAIIETAERVYANIKPGMEIGEIARLALREFEQRGYNLNTKHAFGHAIGTFQHETPILNTTEKRKLEKGMVFCFEPGIYIEGLGGFRLGDLVVMTDNGFVKASDKHRCLNPR